MAHTSGRNSSARRVECARGRLPTGDSRKPARHCGELFSSPRSEVTSAYSFSKGVDVTSLRAGGSSCGQWFADRENPLHHVELNWVLGFLTASEDLLGEMHLPSPRHTDANAVAAWVDKYCRENPLNNTADASVNLVVELSKPKWSIRRRAAGACRRFRAVPEGGAVQVSLCSRTAWTCTSRWRQNPPPCPSTSPTPNWRPLRQPAGPWRIRKRSGQRRLRIRLCAGLSRIMRSGTRFWPRS